MKNKTYSAEAEQSVIAGSMRDTEAAYAARQVVSASDFDNPAHAAIWQAIDDLLCRNRALDDYAVIEQLACNRSLEAAGGADYVQSIFLLGAASANAVSYAHAVRNRSVRRRLVKVSAAIHALAMNGDHDAETMVANAADMVGGVTISTAGEKPEPLNDVLARMIDVLERRGAGEVRGLQTGIETFDNLILPMQPGNLFVIGARPKVGKTILALNIATSVATQGRRVFIWSGEMMNDEVAERIVASRGIALNTLRKGVALDDTDGWNDVADVMTALRGSDITIDQTPSIDIRDLTAKVKAHSRKAPLDLVIVDYLQLITSRGENRYETVSSVSRGLKALAKDVKCPVIALAQMNRSSESRDGDGSRPKASELKESGQIEQDAEAVIILHRSEADKIAGLVEITAELYRSGVPGTVKMGHDGRHTRFVDLSPEKRLPAYWEEAERRDRAEKAEAQNNRRARAI